MGDTVEQKAAIKGNDLIGKSIKLINRIVKIQRSDESSSDCAFIFKEMYNDEQDNNCEYYAADFKYEKVEIAI